jgi:hypothetical protein
MVATYVYVRKKERGREKEMESYGLLGTFLKVSSMIPTRKTATK